VSLFNVGSGWYDMVNKWPIDLPGAVPLVTSAWLGVFLGRIKILYFSTSLNTLLENDF
jgi:hypothetical protein